MREKLSYLKIGGVRGVVRLGQKGSLLLPYDRPVNVPAKVLFYG